MFMYIRNPVTNVFLSPSLIKRGKITKMFAQRNPVVYGLWYKKFIEYLTKYCLVLTNSNKESVLYLALQVVVIPGCIALRCLNTL